MRRTSSPWAIEGLPTPPEPVEDDKLDPDTEEHVIAHTQGKPEPIEEIRAGDTPKPFDGHLPLMEAELHMLGMAFEDGFKNLQRRRKQLGLLPAKVEGLLVVLEEGAERPHICSTCPPSRAIELLQAIFPKKK